MKKIKNTDYFFKKYFFIVFLSIALAISPIYSKPADAWMAIKATFLKQNLEQLWQQVWGILLGAAKQAAAQAIMQQTSNIIGGGGGSQPMFITDFRDFLSVQPRKETNVFMNDYISTYFKGRGSTSYEGFGGGGNSKYVQTLTKMSKAATSENKGPSFTYTGNPEKMFDSGNFKDMSSFMNGNDMWTTRINMLDVQFAKQQELQFVSQTEAISGKSFIGKKQNGKIITPGSLVGDIMANAQNIGNQVIGGANSIPEVIISAVSSAVAQTLQNGIGSAKNYTSESSSQSGNSQSSSDSSGSVYSGSGNIQKASGSYADYKKAQCAATPDDPACK